MENKCDLLTDQALTTPTLALPNLAFNGGTWRLLVEDFCLSAATI
jgi:hypothetical protein